MFGAWGAAIMAKRKRAKELVTEVVGLDENDAIRRIKEANIEVALLGADGSGSDGTFNPDRIGIVVQKGTVVGAQIG